ncbi:MAG: hypothetical protein M1840_004348 [Geoglossum simile]|nr:MAG: hypothetical protein M1840_004348 [Geoglossum simile]
MMKLYFLLSFLSVLHTCASQSLIEATSSYPNLSNFTSLLRNYPVLSATFLNVTRDATILVPSNAAFLDFQHRFGHSIETLDSKLIERILQYHTLNATVKAQDMTKPAGAVVGSQLVDKMYNDRGKWAESNAKSPGQVVYISASAGGTLKRRGLAAREGVATAAVTSGGGAIARLNAVDGVWDGGIFQVVDQ